MRKWIAAILLLGLMILPTSFALATGKYGDASDAYLMEYVEAADLFQMEYINPEDLGDESMPLYLLFAAAIFTAAGIAVVHKMRVKEH